jgi:predicted dehydrogenase
MRTKIGTSTAAAARSERAPIGTAVVGYGYWGPNLVRNVIARPELELIALCERDPRRAIEFTRRVADVPVIDELAVVLDDPRVEAVVVATPPRTHHAIVSAALAAGKHVLVEKPLATTSEDAEDLARLSERHGRVLMPGHTFVYSPPVEKVRRLIDDGVLGEVYFVTSSRMNLGKYQADGVICDLAPHDISILLHWLGRPVVQVTANARSVFQPGVPETAFITLTFEGGAAANVQVSWLAPRKVRQMNIVGSRRMVQYDDTAADEPLRIYDRGMEVAEPETFGEFQLSYRSGDMVAPWLEAAEPLALELEDFARAIATGSTPRSDLALGLAVVQAMEAAQTSMRRDGEPVLLHPPVAVPLAARAVA